MSSLNKENTLSQAHMCQCGDCNNVYYTTPWVTNRWGVRVVCCSYSCYLKAINWEGSRSDYRKTFKNLNQEFVLQAIPDQGLGVIETKIFILIKSLSSESSPIFKSLKQKQLG